MLTAPALLRPEARPDTADWLQLIEELVVDPEQLDQRVRHPATGRPTLARLLGVSLVSLGSFSAIQAALTVAADAGFLDRAWLCAPVLMIAYSGGILGAMAASIPAFFAATMLAGIEAPGWRLVLAFVRGLASSMVTLLGVLPLYALAALVLIRLDSDLVLHSVLFGYGLPFVAGLVGRRSLDRSFALLSDAPGLSPRARQLVGGITALLCVLACGGTTRILLALVKGIEG